jgi:glycosyltransferase involved in cell wall biosynthesis
MNSSARNQESQPLNILHLVSAAGVGGASGGLGPVALGFSKEQKRLGCKPIIWTLDPSSVSQEETKTNGLNFQGIKYFNTFGPSYIGYSPSMEKKGLKKEGSRFDVLHQHGLWLAVTRVTNRWRNAHALSRPTIVAPHGTLDDYALKRSAWKKKIALIAYEMDNLQHAACLHATAISEANSFRNFGLKNPIAIIPNGISDECLKRQGDAARFRSRFSIPSDKRLLLFLSRINPKKGLPLLFTAIAKLDKELEGWNIVIAGFEDVPGYQRELEQLAKSLNISKKIIFVEPLFGHDKQDAFAATDILVLPTHSEGFGIVVIDALAAGVPVLTTYGAPWEELHSHNCGWWVEISEQGIYNGLQDAISRSKQELMEMGCRGKLLVESKYTWPQVTKMTIELYNWLLGRCNMPDFVWKD